MLTKACPIESLLPLLTDRFEIIVVSNKCPFTIGAYLSVVADTLEILITSNSKLRESCVEISDLRLLTSPIGESSQQFALNCQAALSRGWPSIPATPSIFEVSSKGPSSTLLETALARLLQLISKAYYFTAQPANNFALEKLTVGEINATTNQFMGSTAALNLLSHRGPLNFDEELPLNGGIIARKYLKNPGDSDVKIELCAWTRTLGLAGSHRSVSSKPYQFVIFISF